MPEEPDKPSRIREEMRELSAYHGFVGALFQEEDEARAVELVASAVPQFFSGPLAAIGIRVDGDAQHWLWKGQMCGAPLAAATAASLETVLEAASDPHARMNSLIAGDNVPPPLCEVGVSFLRLYQIRTLQRVLGAIVLGSEGPEALVPPQSTILEALANHLAIVVENGRVRSALTEGSQVLEQKVRERTAALEAKGRELDTLLAINRAVTRHLDRDRLFRSIADSIRPVVPFDHMGILLLRGEKQDRIVYVHDLLDLPSGNSLPRKGTVLDWVLEHGRPLVASSCDDLRPFPFSFDAVRRMGMSAVCVLPLRSEEKAVGSLNFYSAKPGHFDEAPIAFLTEVADAIAVALDNCLAYEQISNLQSQLAAENVYLRDEIKTEHNFEEIIGQSVALKEVLSRVEKVAATETTVLITGETGTGKELIARAVHNLSARKHRPLIKVNCAALPANLIESELFGHEMGAFTGALSRKAGRFELADGGTIFLDEISELQIDLQARLLRVLQEREFERVGGTETVKIDVRVIAATNRNLRKLVHKAEFREDLYYRVSVFPVRLPPLRERVIDIPALVAFFVERYAKNIGRKFDSVTAEAMREFQRYSWPGNIRELQNVVERAVILSTGTTLTVDTPFHPAIGLDAGAAPSDGKIRSTALEDVERDHIRRILTRTGTVIEGPNGAAKLLKMHPSTLRSRMRKLGVGLNKPVS